MNTGPTLWRVFIRLSKARFTRQSFPRASSQRHRICGWENPDVLTSNTLVSVLVAMTYVHVVTANHSLSVSELKLMRIPAHM
jgi:hypothetical protein